MMSIICGGRDYADANRVRTILDAAVTRKGLWCIIQGNARGADALAAEWATNQDRISMISVPADWDGWEDRGNKGAAGPVRNKMMLSILLGHDGEKAVIAFPVPGAENRGTNNMIAQAKGAGIRIIEA